MPITLIESAYSSALPPSLQAPLTPGVTTSKSQVPKTLKKDLKAIEERLARFRMDAVLPGTSGLLGGRQRDGRERGGTRGSTSLSYFPSSSFTFLLGVPATKPLSELQAPVTKMTTLENGLRVATQETYGAVSQQRVACGGRACMQTDVIHYICDSSKVHAALSSVMRLISTYPITYTATHSSAPSAWWSTPGAATKSQGRKTGSATCSRPWRSRARTT